MNYLSESEPQFQKGLEHLTKELNAIRTGRSSPALVEDLSVEAYGARQPLKALASISTPDAKTVQIEPWDGSIVKAIEIAIMQSSIGISPNVDGKIIRLFMPMMTEETREKMVKAMKEKLEEGHVAMRKIREEAKKKIEADESLSEDMSHQQLESLDKRIKEINGKIDEIGKRKEEEIMKV
ncbi:MAG: ribosome recycling factor [Patescibacteria group bacterium]|jgi:ribosome recycling factor